MFVCTECGDFFRTVCHKLTIINKNRIQRNCIYLWGNNFPGFRGSVSQTINLSKYQLKLYTAEFVHVYGHNIKAYTNFLALKKREK